MKSSREKTIFHKGVLESAGLGEVAFFLKKAKQNILYAEMTLEHTDFSSTRELVGLHEKANRLRDLIAEMSSDIEAAGNSFVEEIERREFEEDEAPVVESE